MADSWCKSQDETQSAQIIAEGKPWQFDGIRFSVLSVPSVVNEWYPGVAFSVAASKSIVGRIPEDRE